MAVTHLCDDCMHYGDTSETFANNSIFDVLQDMAPDSHSVVMSHKWKYETFSSIEAEISSVLTEEGLCFAFNAVNSHEVYTDE